MKTKNKKVLAPLLCWDIYAQHISEQAIKFNRETEIEFLNNCKDKYGWNFDVENTLANHQFDAIVLTGPNIKIEWVNKGFSKMTGYPASYAKGKKPSFLQGASTSKQAIKRVRQFLNKSIQFKETLINYKKNGDVYNCLIEIYPLKDKNNKVMHFLALEKELSL